MKISVIVPVYNVEEYLSKCLDSLVNQTLKEIEIIVVNDGSPDNSEKIINKYLKKYSNIRYYKKKNGGLSDARNFGLEYAVGEYISFVDSDDYLLCDGLEKMYLKAKEKDYDMVVSDINYVFPNKTLKVSSNVSEKKSLKDNMTNIYPAVCNKIFKRELFDNKVRFKKGIWFEDVEFLYRLYPYIKSIGVIDDAYYQYTQREGSIVNTVNLKIYDYIDNMNSIVDFYKEKGFYQEYQKELEYVYVRYIYATFIKRVLPFDCEEYKKAVDKAINNVQKKFKHYRRNKYFYKSLKGLYLVFFNKTLAKIMYRIRRK